MENEYTNDIISSIIKLIYAILGILLILYYFFPHILIHLFISALSGSIGIFLYFLLVSYKYEELSFFIKKSIVFWFPLILITIITCYFNLLDAFFYLLVSIICISIFVWYWKTK
jgi:hypothetical protein